MLDFHVKSETFKVQDYFKDGKNVLHEGKLDFLMFKDGTKHTCQKDVLNAKLCLPDSIKAAESEAAVIF